MGDDRRARATRSSSSARTSTPCRTAAGSTAASAICAALEVLRAHKGETPAVTLKLVDWADEEGARFGRSLLGSSAAAGTLDPDAVRDLKDNQGIALPDALKENGVDLDTMGEAELPDIAAYLELHIEQGPRLEEMGKPAAAVIGCFGVERHAITFTGKASHAGTHADEPAPRRVPRRRALRPRRARERDRARRRRHDRHRHRRARHPDDHQPALRGHARPARVHARAARATCSPTSRPRRTRIAEEEGVEVEWKRIWQIDPIPFDDTLVDLAAQAVGEITGDDDPPRLPSGALHDCAEVARALPAVMVFSLLDRRRQPLAASRTPPRTTCGSRCSAYGRLYELTRGDDLRAVGLERLVLARRSSGRRSTRRRRSPPGRAASPRTARPSRSRRSGRRSRPVTNEPCAAPTREWSL